MFKKEMNFGFPTLTNYEITKEQILSSFVQHWYFPLESETGASLHIWKAFEVNAMF